MSGLPACRFGDMHDCPACTPPDGAAKPKWHRGGVLVGPGAFSVLIEGVRASMLADFARCTGNDSYDVVTQGASTVLIEQLPAARASDHTLHGGAIRLGAIRTLIGGPTFAVPRNVSIGGPPERQNRVVRDLYLIWMTPAGKEWLARLAAHPGRVVIADGDKSGTNTVIESDGTIVIVYDSITTGKYESGKGGYTMPAEPQSALAHEIIHAVHMSEGTFAKDDNLNRTQAEESRTTVAEGEVRKQWGLIPRLAHEQHMDGQPWTPTDSPPSPLRRPGRY